MELPQRGERAWLERLSLAAMLYVLRARPDVADVVRCRYCDARQLPGCGGVPGGGRL
jgi:hypothetical protein